MEIRKYTSLHAFNKLGMSEFRLHSIEYAHDGPFQNAIFLASRGYMEYFGAEIKFIGIEYIASARFFTHGELRQASLQEFPLAREYPNCIIYCFEEHFSPPDETPIRHYVVARDVEITAHYAGKNTEDVFGPSDRIEGGGLVK